MLTRVKRKPSPVKALTLEMPRHLQHIVIQLSRGKTRGSGNSYRIKPRAPPSG